jgi:hypothetical protein
MNVLWATTFSADLYAETGHKLIESFLATKTDGTLAVFCEGMDVPKGDRIVGQRIDDHPFLVKFLKDNTAVIPKALGGSLEPPECKCKGGPFPVNSKKHKLPCPGYWFCKNSFRWLRKVLAAKLAADDYYSSHDAMMWVDSDATFKQKVTPGVVQKWFPGRVGCIYLKSTRAEIETGVVGYHLKNGGRKVLKYMLERYRTGKFREDRRWDDCHQLGIAVRKAKTDDNVRSIDVATKVGENSTVIQFSPLGPYLGHDKGHHRRSGKMK